MRKRCSRCGEKKDEAQFHRGNHRDGLQVYCKPCRRAYDAAYHQRVKDRRREQKRRRERELRAFVNSLKRDRPCAECGGFFDLPAMQWDHLPGFIKTGNLGDIGHRTSRRRILEEIAKCELVCANCHAIRTVRRRAGRSSAW
jgi:hypothetical protein